MRSGSVRRRIILLYTLSVLLLCGATAAFLFIVEDRLIIEEAKENLTALTDSAVGAISFENGRIVTDDHMTWYLEGTYVIICGPDGEVLAGQLPEGFENTPGFEPDQIRKVKNGSSTFYIYDEPLDGAEELACAVDGPIVLAGLTDRDAGLTGNLNDPQSILLPEHSHTYGTFVWSQNVYLTRKQKENFRLVPLYEVTNEAYTVYFTSES